MIALVSEKWRGRTRTAAFEISSSGERRVLCQNDLLGGGVDRLSRTPSQRVCATAVPR